MTTNPTEQSLIEEVEELLAKLPAWQLTAIEWGNEQRIGYYEHGERFSVAKVHSFEGPEIDRPLAQLFANAPELLHRLVEENKRLRETLTALYGCQNKPVCGHCNALLRATLKEHK